MDDETTEGFYEVAPPSWKFSPWDLAGIAMHTASGILVALSQGAALLSQECAASANRARALYDERAAAKAEQEAREAIGADLARLIEGDGE